MKRKNILVLLLATGITGFFFPSFSQTLVESVAGIVGNEVILLSDVENAALELRRQGTRLPLDEIRCRTYQELLTAKLFVDQARIDSVEVSGDMVESDLNMQLNDAIRRAGSEKALEDYFKKSMIEIKMDLRKSMLENQLVQEVQNNIAKNLKITPSDVRRFYNGIPKDSLPVIPARVQISLIQIDPPDNEENKAAARQKLLEIRGEILAGKSFSLLAILNSEDGSASAGGEIGYKMRGELEKEYADAAWSLQKNSVSKIVETKYGYHLIQMIDRKGDLVNTRHILIRPKVKPEQIERAVSKLDSIARLIRKDSLKFEDAALRFSTHSDSRINGGKYVSTDPSERITWFSLDELNREMYMQVRDLKPGEISDPFQTTDEAGNPVFRIVRLDDELPAHRLNLKDDYQFVHNAAMMAERQKIYSEWIANKIETTYIKVSDEFKSCDFLEEGWLK